MDLELDVDIDEVLGLEPERPDAAPANVRLDPRRHKVVCKHWLRNLCMKGDKGCPYLHYYDPGRMPECMNWPSR